MVMEVVPEEDTGLCANHPYRNNNAPGGICASCLQQKLGTLVSSSSPSFRSEVGSDLDSNGSFPFVSGHKKRNKDVGLGALAFTRTPRSSTQEKQEESPHRKGFWSFLYVSKPTRHRTIVGDENRSKEKKGFMVVDNEGSPSCDTKVSRSRSIGCGSMSFSGDFFERLSNGFSDCALRRLESHKGQQDGIKEVMGCSRIFSGFNMTSSSSSSSSSSYWDSTRVRRRSISTGSISNGAGRSKS